MIPTELDFEFKDNKYRITPLDAMSSFHVSRKLAPVLVASGSSLFAALRAKDEGQRVQLDDMMLVAGPVADVISKMSNEDVEYVIQVCLRAVKRRSGDKFAPMVSATGAFMFQDVGMAEMLRLTVEVVRVSLGDFFGMALGEATS